MKKFCKNIFVLFAISATIVTGCTDLVEEPYDQIVSSNFYQTKSDVYRSFLRTFEHGYWSIQSASYQLQELTADQLMTPNRQGHWYDGGKYARLHYHTWNFKDNLFNDAWRELYIGISLANNALEDIRALNGADFDISDSEQKMLIAELRTMRAWYYLKLYDFYRNIPIVKITKGAEQKPSQNTPKEVFEFIETELKEAIADLGTLADADVTVNRWTQAGAAALLSRLYLNAEVYIGEDKYTECADICQKIIGGQYGTYGIAERWDEPFDWNNDKCKESIFAFPGSFGRTHWHYEGGMYWWSLPYNIDKYLEFDDWGIANPKFALQPGRDVRNQLYNFTSGLGQPFVKFQKYEDDVRLGIYKNTGDQKREGMFLYGYLTYNNDQDTLRGDHGDILYIRDQVGWFNNTPPDEIPSDLTSTMDHADQNSGVYHVKYPFYKATDDKKIESDYVEIRMAEIYYALAECKLRAGQTQAAEELLNTVRKRYYPANSSSLYNGELDMAEMLDEWGREFLAEGRRRSDLIRFGKFCSSSWWDKTPDEGEHTKLFPIGEEILNVSTQLKQNPGYNK